MRILVVAPGPAYSVADVQRGWTRALERQGHEVRTYNLDDRLSTFAAAQFGEDGATLSTEDAVRLAVEPLGSACYKFWPDVVLIISGFFIPEDMWNVWKHRPQKTVLLCTESPYEDDVQFQRVVDFEPDVVLLNDPAHIDTFREHHPRVWYAPHAYDPEIHTPGERSELYDFGFVGTGYGSRVDLFSRIDWHGIDTALAGNWKSVGGTCLEDFVIHPLEDCFENSDAVELYRSCKVSANLYRARSGTSEANDERLTQGLAVGPREIELAATQTFFLREPRPEGDELFPFLPTFTEPGDFEEKLRYYLAHDLEREAAALRARLAIEDRTFDASARRLMKQLPD